MHQVEERKKNERAVGECPPSRAVFFADFFSILFLFLPPNQNKFTQVDAAVVLATKLYSSSAKELSDQVRWNGFVSLCSRVARGRAGRGEARREANKKSQGHQRKRNVLFLLLSFSSLSLSLCTRPPLPLHFCSLFLRLILASEAESRACPTRGTVDG